MIRVRVRNFQSIVDAEIVVDGLTVVTGQNNSGKTAVMRAVHGVFTNASGNALVRHGEDHLSVDLDFGEGQEVRWEKGPKIKPRYTIDGKVIAAGRQVPDEVTALGVQPIQAGATIVWPQIAPQFSGQVFLLDLPGSAMAEAVADVERVGRLTQALKYAESHQRAANDRLKVRRQDVSSLREEILQMAGLDAVADHVGEVEVALEQLRKSEGVVADVRVLDVRLQSAKADVARFNAAEVIQAIPGKDVQHAAASAKQELAVLRALRERLNRAQTAVGNLSGVVQVHVPSAPTEATGITAQLSALRPLQTRHKVATEQVGRLSGSSKIRTPSAPTEAPSIIVQLSALRPLQTRHKVAHEQVERCVKASEPAAAWVANRGKADTTKLSKCIKMLASFADLSVRHKSASSGAAETSTSLEVQRKEAAEVASTLQTILGDMKACPTCGALHPGGQHG